jgi:hypothetical protein
LGESMVSTQSYNVPSFRNAKMSPWAAKGGCPGGWVTLVRATGDESGASERYPRPDGTEC